MGGANNTAGRTALWRVACAGADRTPRSSRVVRALEWQCPGSRLWFGAGIPFAETPFMESPSKPPEDDLPLSPSDDEIDLNDEDTDTVDDVPVATDRHPHVPSPPDGRS